jgi:predicted permease
LTGLNEAAAWSDRDDLVRFVWILSTVVVLTLLIACFNVGNLIFVRNGHRALELSVRASLGASRGRLAQQLMLESLLIGVSGAVAGVLLGRAGLRLIGSFTLPGDIRLRDISFTRNHRVLGVTIALGVLTALIFGLAPIGQASRADLNARLRGARATMSTRARRWFLGAEIALSIILLVGAGLFVRSLQKGLHSDLGFNPSPLAAIRINPALSGYRGAQLSGFYQLATERASQIPGVTGVALSSHVPLSSISPLPFVASEKLGASSIDDQVSAGWVYVSAGFFDVLGVPIIDGRGFMPNDSASSSVAIINQTAAETLFPDGHPVGKEIVHAGSMHFTVIGVVRDTKYQSVADRRVPMVFTPMESDYGDDVHLVVRSNRPVAALEDLRRVVRSIPPYTPIQDARLVQRQIDRVLEPQRFGSTLLGSYSIIALVIASVGVYGLFAYAVSTQRREIGIRIALGAQAPEIVRLLAARTVVAVLGGVIVGLLGGVAASRAMTRFLYGVAPTDPPTYAAAASVMLAASIIACVPSVRRALRIDPVTSMRIE